MLAPNLLTADGLLYAVRTMPNCIPANRDEQINILSRHVRDSERERISQVLGILPFSYFVKNIRDYK